MTSQTTAVQNTLSLESVAADYGRLVSSVCRRMIRDDDRARDAAQQVWVEIVKALPAFRGESKVSTWIYTITRRVAMGHVRKEQLYSGRFLLDHAQGEEYELPSAIDHEKELWIRQECDKCITAALHCFDYEDRLAMLLKDIAELSYEDVATVLGKEEAAVRQMVSRNRRKLQYFMNDLCILSNPSGTCRCRMKKLVRAINLPQEYEKVRRIVGKASFFKQSEMVLPSKDFWKNLL